MTPTVSCHICGGVLRPLEGFESLLQVTSDCRVWREGGELAVCGACGAVQKPMSERWQREADEIYSAYDIYSQSGGTEQSVFDPGSGAGAARSQRIVEWLSRTARLPAEGTLLDVGCGNGAFLRAFGAHHPGWKLSGLELNDLNKDAIEAIPGVTRLYIGSLEDVHEKFDQIVLVHALEHIPHPIAYLRSLRRYLNPNGLLLVEVPDLASSPFDILIADHSTHFTADVLADVAVGAGLEIVSLSAGMVPKELSLLARAPGGAEAEQGNGPRPASAKGTAETAARANIEWLHGLIRQGRAVGERVGIFGTSISATWLAALLGSKAEFFIDEDPARGGRTHMSRPIHTPESAPRGIPVMLPLRQDIAKSVARRLAPLDLRFIQPPG